jgi:hypothetical protein
LVCHSSISVSTLRMNSSLSLKHIGQAPLPTKSLKVARTVEQQQKKQKRKADEGQLLSKRKEMDKAKVILYRRLCRNVLTVHQITDAVKRYSYLLGQTELFKHFVDIKVRYQIHFFPAVSQSPISFPFNSVLGIQSTPP